MYNVAPTNPTIKPQIAASAIPVKIPEKELFHVIRSLSRTSAAPGATPKRARTLHTRTLAAARIATTYATAYLSKPIECELDDEEPIDEPILFFVLAIVTITSIIEDRETFFLYKCSDLAQSNMGIRASCLDNSTYFTS